ncbi:UNVERIFIED_CONTAM: hypothetical protein HDU68_001607 [Siphonaria sp. JEL0065]|nr:hypothetical protein HDU68_001607 [Siphonaria sp. JEL0065]
MALIFLALTTIFAWHANAHANNQIPLVLQPETESIQLTRNVAIIGAGAAGASTSYFINKFTPSYNLDLNNVHISLFEASDRIGGRAKNILIQNPRNSTSEPVSIEIGASIFVTSNKHLMDAVKEYNLSFTSSQNDEGRPGGKSIKYPELGIYNGTQFLFTAQSENTWKTMWDAVWRWGLLSPYRARVLALSTSTEFSNAYELESLGKMGYKTVKEMLIQGFGMDSQILHKNAREYLLEKGVGEAFLNEFVEPATRVNYGQNLDCNAIAAMICLTAAFVPADSVVGGNSLIYKKMVEQSKASVRMNTKVGEVRKDSDGRYLLLDVDGKVLGIFDEVIVAVPSNAAGKIKFTSLQQSPKPIDFVRLHVTIVTGSLNAFYFNLPDQQLLPSAILTTKSSGPTFNSIGTRHRFKNDPFNTTITKIFSSSKISDALLEKLYSRTDRVDRFEWDAYPVLKPLAVDDEMQVVLDRGSKGGGVYYVNAFESAFSAMESQTVASSNVVQLMLESWVKQELQYTRTSCNRCYSDKKKCIPIPSGVCERCNKKGRECSFSLSQGSSAVTNTLLDQYMELSDTSLLDLEVQNRWNTVGEPPTFAVRTTINNQIPSFSALDYITSMAEMPLTDHEDQSWDLENPDLMATIDDWALVFNFLSPQPIRFSYDGDNLIKTFFHQPAGFRLILCAFAAFNSNLLASLQLSYYNRARKALIRAINEKPSHQTVQALLSVFGFAEMKGQPDIGHAIFQTALNMVATLRLDIDPDDSPWLYHLNLTERQKEDRRRAFWGCYITLVTEQALSPTNFSETSLSATKIKEPATIMDPHLVFQGNCLVKPECELFRMIAMFRRHYSRAPRNISEIMNGLPMETLELESIISAIPITHYLSMDSIAGLTHSDHYQFLRQFGQMPATEISSAFTVNFVAPTSICVLYRPQLQLSACKSCHPTFISSVEQNVIVLAIQKCLDAANQIAYLYSFLQDIIYGVYKDCIPDHRKIHFELGEDTGIYMLFEAITVFWFVLCRMNPVWWHLVGRNVPVWSELQPRIVQMIDFVKKVGNEGGMTDGCCVPLILTLDAMLNEIDSCMNGGMEENMDKILVGMTVLTLDAEVAVAVKEPRALLGLLGLEVGGVQWMGRVEENMITTIFIASASIMKCVSSQAVSPWDVAAVWPLVAQGSYYGIGESNAFQWNNNDTNTLTAPITTVSLVLGNGSSNKVTELYQLASLPWPATTCFEWTPPVNLTTSANYTIVWKGMDTNKNLVSVNYCTWFNLAEKGDAAYPTASMCEENKPIATKTTTTVAPPPVIVPATSSVVVQTVSTSPPVPTKNEGGIKGASAAFLALFAFFFF